MSLDESSRKHRFYIQRHLASRLHYDFRLEIDGVLRSWAVPKGPTLSPLVRRLAMLVEDHPLSYGSFEGNILPGNYGAGSVMLWDYGVYSLAGADSAAAQFARGDLKFQLQGQKLQGEFAIVRLARSRNGNEWLLIKKRDQFAVADWDANDYAFSALSGRTQEAIAEL